MARLSQRARGKATSEIIGIEQVENVLDRLPKRLNRKLLNQACRGSAKYIDQAAKWNVRPHSKTVAKQTGIWSLKRSRRAGVWVGWDGRKRKRDYDRANTTAEKKWAWLGGLLLEYGTRDTKYRQIQPVGWFRRAVDTKLPQTERDFKKVLAKTINRFLDKWITKHGW